MNFNNHVNESILKSALISSTFERASILQGSSPHTRQQAQCKIYSLSKVPLNQSAFEYALINTILKVHPQIIALQKNCFSPDIIIEDLTRRLLKCEGGESRKESVYNSSRNFDFCS